MLPSNSTSSRCENDAFVRGFCHIPRVEDTKTKLSCDASVKFHELKMRKRSFPARLPSNFKSWRCMKMWAHVFNAAVPMEKVSQAMQNTASSTKTENHVEPSVPLRAQFAVQPATPATVAHTSLLFTAPVAPFTRKNTMFRTNPNIQMTCMMYKNAAFVRCFRRIPRIEDTKTKLSWQTSFKFH